MMVILGDLFDPADLAAAIEAGHVTRRPHPTLPLSIYTYTRAAQYAAAWTPVTLRCRGLVADDRNGQVVAHCLPKFFNTVEHNHDKPYAPALPDEPFEVYEKVDGSLGIVFHYAGQWHAASKGSFAGEQATWAQQWIDAHDTSLLVEGFTYIAEIIYPENRIVVDYGDRRDMVLLTAFDSSGKEIRLSSVADHWEPIGSVIRTWGAVPLPDLLKLTEANARPDGRPVSGMAAEGYVIRYASGLRTKAKFADYVRLHKVLTGITERDIWRYLGMQRFADQDPKSVAKALGCPVAEVAAFGAAGVGPLDALLEQVPDEFDAWVRSVAASLDSHAAECEVQTNQEYAVIAHLAGDRGEFARAAQRVKDHGVRAAMFLMLDDKPTGLHLWRSIRPETSAAFAADPL
ncbi:RNA ligase [Streptomyces sp. NPDC059651]|uniref:RNA ligase n=1 Tax=Streptomyces sp. NPDC059651 TaxID=3346897 RepID=UPI0036A93B65